MYIVMGRISIIPVSASRGSPAFRNETMATLRKGTKVFEVSLVRPSSTSDVETVP
jgi:hypothetical protein